MAQTQNPALRSVDSLKVRSLSPQSRQANHSGKMAAMQSCGACGR